MSYEVLIGDCVESMKKLPDESVDMCVTSPPYWGLRDYGGNGKVWGGDPSCSHDWEGYTRPSENTRNNDNSLQLKSAYWEPQDQAFCKHCDAWFGQLGLEPTPQQFVKNMVEVFEEVRRILKPHGTLWLNLGDSYCGTGHKGTDMKDKKHPEGRNGQVVAVNNKIEGLKRKDLVGIPWRVAFALQEAGWYLRQDIIWAKPNCMPEPVKDRCTKSHEYLFLLSKKDSYFFDHEAIKEASADHEKTAARYTQPFGGIKNETLLETDQVHIRPIGMREFSGKRNKRSVWTVNPKPFREAHFAVYPPELIEPCILAGSSAHGCCADCGVPYVRVVEKKDMGITEAMKVAGANAQGTYEGKDLKDYKPTTMSEQTPRTVKQRTLDAMSKKAVTVGWEATCECNADIVPAVVFDPFGGSGTTAGVAIKHGRDAILCELNEEYAELIPNRVESISQIQKETLNDEREWL
jgi:DNA modification methylase